MGGISVYWEAENKTKQKNFLQIEPKTTTMLTKKI
jgi:hypothetical protein